MSASKRHAKFAETSKETVQAASGTIFTVRNFAILAGAALLVPYLVRRLMPLITGDVANVSAHDLEVAGKDSIRDAADDLGVGGLTGTVKRNVGRVADRLQS